MKMKLFTLIALIVMGTVNMAAASETVAKANAADVLAKIIKEKVDFPRFLKADGVKTTSVMVEFTLNEEGKVDVINTNECDAKVRDYVIQQIEDINLSGVNHEADEVYMIKLNFKLL
jgi:hypothetical protein